MEEPRPTYPLPGEDGGALPVEDEDGPDDDLWYELRHDK